MCVCVCVGGRGVSVCESIHPSYGLTEKLPKNCTTHQCLPLRRKFMECYIIKPAQLLLMKHLVIGQR